jgi:4-amino-4-deoxy-L-arabinose transferase-like glycosyltransferase
MSSSRARAVLDHPILWVALIYLAGIILRVQYTLNVHPPEAQISSDMGLYVGLARKLAGAADQLRPWDVTHPLGYPALVAFLLQGGTSFARVVGVQIVVSCLLPLAMGLLGLATFGRRTALAVVAFASLYFPFIEYGALFLSEIHFILFLTLAFAGLHGARTARRPGVSLALAAGGGVALSIAAALKSVALPAAAAFFALEGLALVLGRAREGAPLPWRAWLKPWLLRGVVVAVAAAPLLGVLARVCTQANRGKFCVTGNKVGADFLLGHYGRIADIQWGSDEGNSFHFGSPSSHLRHYDIHKTVPFPITDSAANAAEAWRWIFAHPFDAMVISLDHLYDTFFGPSMWPAFDSPSWAYGHLSQYVFVLFLFVPALFACGAVLRRGARAFAMSRTALVLAPIGALAFTVAVATGEVRYRIPFDIFFIVVACASFVGELAQVDGTEASSEPAAAPPAPEPVTAMPG